MPSMDVFTNDAFSTRSLTAAINKLPHQPTRIRDLGLFAEKGVRTTQVMVEEKSGTLTLIPFTPRGGPSDTVGQNKRTVRSFTVPHLQREATILADEVQGIRAFGSETDLQSVQELVNDRMATLRAMHDVTLEWLRMGALKGEILDANLSSYYNLFTEFGLSQQIETFTFTSDTEDIRGHCVAALRKIDNALGAATYQGARAFCSATFFDALVGHPMVRDSLKYQESQLTREDLRKGFVYGGITFEEYRGTVGAINFIDADEAYLFPVGAVTMNGPLFQTWFAPADFEETVNTLGLPLYAKQAPDTKFNRFIELHTQSNPLPICLIPSAVIKLRASTES